MKLLVLLLIAAFAFGQEKQPMPKAGEYWYAMRDAEGKPTGFAHLVIRDREGGGIDIEWELKIAFPGGTYEEERTSSFDGVRRMLSAGIKDGRNEILGRREGSKLLLTGVEGKESLEVADDAVAGMGFLLAASMPLETGEKLTRTDLNEAQGFEHVGTVTFEVGKKEATGGRDAWKVVMTRADGNELPLWVSEDRVILRADWGGGNHMTWSAEPARGLFKPEAPAFVEARESTPERLVVVGDFAGIAPAEMFRLWTEPEKLKLWWPQEAVVEPEVGGTYHMIWKQPEWTMRGEIRALEKEKRLAFSWRWDHLPDNPVLEVSVAFEPIDGGTQLRISHGPYAKTEKDQKERLGHFDGWKFFGSKLRALAK